MPRTILAFNGDLESRLALHWLVHERGYEVVTLSLNLGQEVYLEPLGELALELGASAARIVDRRLRGGTGRSRLGARRGGGHGVSLGALRAFSVQKHHFTAEPRSQPRILPQPMLRRMMGFCHSAFAKARQIVARVDADALDCPGARVLATHIHPWRALMKTILTLLLVGLFAFGTAYAADTKTDAKA